MEFQTEYDILRSIKSDQILEIAFIFKGHKIKIYFSQRQENEFLTLICESEKESFVKNYGIFYKKGLANISGYWDKYFKYAKGLRNATDGKFTEFYDKLSQSINSIKEPCNEFVVSYHDYPEGIRKINKDRSVSVNKNEAIYFYHVRRSPIGEEQFKKVSNILGKDVAKHLKESRLTAVFTSDITKQKTFILEDQHDNENHD